MDKKIQVFEIYLVDGWPHGYEITDKPYPARSDGYGQTYLFTRKNATFCVVSNDRGIDRTIAIGFAHAIFTGRYRTRHIDLTTMTASTSYGEQ